MQRKQQGNMTTNNSTSLPLAFLCAAVVLLLIAGQSTRLEARYLPTRADETDVEVLRNLIRNLMFESENNMLARNLDRMEGRQRNGRSEKQCIQQQQQQSPLQIQKRALELPLSSVAGDSTIRVPMDHN